MSDEKLVERITAELDASVERLDAATRSRLNQARHRALATRQQRRWHWPAVGVAVAASLLAVVLWQGESPQEPTSLVVLDYELLNSGDSIELYQEMEFLEATEQNDVV